jgi:hypothetical protein
MHLIDHLLHLINYFVLLPCFNTDIFANEVVLYGLQLHRFIYFFNVLYDKTRLLFEILHDLRLELQERFFYLHYESLIAII